MIACDAHVNVPWGQPQLDLGEYLRAAEAAELQAVALVASHHALREGASKFLTRLNALGQGRGVRVLAAVRTASSAGSPGGAEGSGDVGSSRSGPRFPVVWACTHEDEKEVLS